MDVDVKGAMNLIEEFEEDVISIFIEPPGMNVQDKIESLNDCSKSMPDKLNKDVRMKRDITNINIVKKYLLISLKSKFILVNINLFIKTFFGLLNDKI